MNSEYNSRRTIIAIALACVLAGLLATASLAPAANASTRDAFANGGAIGTVASLGGKSNATVAARNNQDWTNLWQQVSTEPVPVIDFTKSQVIGAFVWTSTGAYDMTATFSAKRRSAKVKASVRSTLICGQVAVMSTGYRYSFMLAPRSLKNVRLSVSHVPRTACI